MCPDIIWCKRSPATSSLRGSTTTFYHHKHFAPPPLNYFAHSALKSTPMTPGWKCLLPTTTTSTLCSPPSRSFGSLSTRKSQSAGSQAPERDLVLALTSITWPWFSGGPAWLSDLLHYLSQNRESFHPSSLTLHPICDPYVSIQFSLISRRWYRTPPWVKEAQRWIIDKLEAIKSISLKGSGHVTGGKVFLSHHIKSREEECVCVTCSAAWVQMILDWWQETNRWDIYIRGSSPSFYCTAEYLCLAFILSTAVCKLDCL